MSRLVPLSLLSKPADRGRWLFASLMAIVFVAIIVGWFNWLGSPPEPEPDDVSEREGLP